MVAIERPGGARGLVNMDNGSISRDIFVSEELYQQELERVFTRSWLFVGHESQIPNPNDFFTSRMGEESVIMTRDRQGEIHVLLNTCRHRGMKVCRYDEGNTPVFSCPYHGWSYSTDGNLVSVPGELIGVPQFATAYHGELEKEEWGLISVPKMANYHGSIWACWDKDAPDFLDYIGGIEPYLATQFDAADSSSGGRMVFAGVQKWLMPCNWKFPSENFIGDGYHGTSHRSQVLSQTRPYIHREGIPLPQDQQKLRELTGARQMRFPGGHGVLSGILPSGWTDRVPYRPKNEPVLDDYFAPAHEEREKRLGGRGALPIWSSPLTIFPNMSIGGGCTSVAVWHPVGPRMTEAWRFYFVDKDAPEEVKKIWREDQISFSGPGGRVESDDMENWNYASEASSGMVARRSPYNYMQGLAYEEEVAGLPGAEFSQHTSEQNARGLYWRWAQMMDAESWDELRRWDAAKARDAQE